MSAPPPEFLTVKEVAVRLRTSPQTVRNWIETGKVRAMRVGRAFLVRSEDLEQILAELTPPDPELRGGWDARAPGVRRLIERKE
jgi:excisionase family DNA binding protein